MNPLWTGFDPDVAIAIAILGALIIAVIVTGWFLEPRPPVTDESLPFPPSVGPESTELLSSLEAFHRLAEARADLLRINRSGTPLEIRAACYAHSDAVTAYIKAVGRELRS